MRLTCERADLLSAVTPATYVATKSTQTAAGAGGIHFKAEGDTLTLSAYDMEKGIRATTNLSYPQIGKEFDRDHATIMSSEENIRERMSDPLFEMDIQNLIRELS